MKHYVSFDLHSNNACCLIIDENEKTVFKRKFKNELPLILQGIEPFRETICMITVEATYNWYWLVDGLMDAGYAVRLAHPAAIEGYHGKKVTNDFDDARKLAELLKDGKLPQGYIYPKAIRPLRDLLRKRILLVREKTRFQLSFINQVNRNLGEEITSNEVKQILPKSVEQFFNQKHLILSGKAIISTIRHLKNQIEMFERAIKAESCQMPQYKILLTVPGIGAVIAATIAYEAGEMSRFKKVGNYLSYCRLVDSKKFSNKKVKGENNRKNGNKYLCWAYIEAANFAKRYCPYAQAYYRHKLKMTGSNIVAIKSLAAKLARATYYMITHNEPYKPEKIFEPFKAQAKALILEKQKDRDSKSSKGTGSNPSA